MGIESIFRKSRATQEQLRQMSVHGAMRDYVNHVSSAVRTLAQIEELLSKPRPEHIKGITSRVTLAPLPDYHPEGCLRILFDDETKQPIGAELVAVEEGPDGT